MTIYLYPDITQHTGTSYTGPRTGCARAPCSCARGPPPPPGSSWPGWGWGGWIIFLSNILVGPNVSEHHPQEVIVVYYHEPGVDRDLSVCPSGTRHLPDAPHPALPM